MKTMKTTSLLLSALLLAACGGAAYPAASTAPELAGERAEQAEEVDRVAEMDGTTSGGAADDLDLLDSGGDGDDERGADPMMAFQHDTAVAELMVDFERAIELSAPDCPQAGELRESICDLAGRICDIAREHPSDVEVLDKCQRGRERCASAGERLAARCEE